MMFKDEEGATTRSLRRVVVRLVLTTALSLVLAAAAVAQTPPKTHLKVGDPAPDFTLIDTKRQPVKLSDFKGKKSVVLAFYVLAFTGG
jgi:cytochrome oxidase Cu insertion factor (SCO1/SenC/PrrC family)